MSEPAEAELIRRMNDGREAEMILHSLKPILQSERERIVQEMVTSVSDDGREFTSHAGRLQALYDLEQLLTRTFNKGAKATEELNHAHTDAR